MGRLDFTIATAQLEEMRTTGATRLVCEEAQTSYGLIPLAVNIDVDGRDAGTLALKPALTDLRACIETNGVIGLDDNDLLEMARLLAVELRQRLPEAAVRQGGLPEDFAEAAGARRLLVTQIATAEIDPETAGQASA